MTRRAGAKPRLDLQAVTHPSVASMPSAHCRLVTWARQIPRIVLEIVRKPEGQRGHTGS